LEIARKVRQQNTMNYEVPEKARELRRIMQKLGVEDYKIRFRDNTAEINYGIWIEIRKPTPKKP